MIQKAMQLQELMIQKKKTLAIAESCTGGFLSHLITRNPGSSKYFLGSFVTYSESLKQSVLGVKEETLRSFGVVSEQVVLEMIQGVFNLTQADLALCISGIAGPDGGSEEKPIGTVWIAYGKKGEVVQTMALKLLGDRFSIIQEASNLCLDFLYKKV